jgi:hypothetical protein
MELGTVADVEGERVDVIVAYETDGYQPLIYGIFAESDDSDLTLLVSESEYDRLYEEVSQHVIERMNEAAEMAAKGDR